MNDTVAATAAEVRLMLDIADGHVSNVAITYTRPVQAAQVFLGRPVEEAIGLIGSVFSLCGRAQTIAALNAAEAAMGICAAPAVVSARDVLRFAEMFTQTAMRLALQWPRALGLALEPGLVRLALKAEQVIEHEMLGAGWKAPGSGALQPAPAVDRAIDRLTDAADTFVSHSVLGRELQRLGLSGFGALADGMPAEDGPLRRNWDQTTVAEIRARHGPGLAARLEASLTDLALLPGWMLAVADTVEDTAARQSACSSGQGEAEVETARGALRHAVILKDGIAVGCRIDAPTDRNFRPGGPVAAGLIGAPAEGLELAARLHVLAIDPCVEFRIETRHA